MTKLPLSLAVSCSLVLSSLSACRAAEPDTGQIAVSVAKALEKLHYTRHPLDKSVSERLLKTYLDTLDYNKLFFTQADIEGFEKKYGAGLSDDIWLGQLDPAYTIYDTYLKRVEARVGKIKEVLKNEKFDFTGHGSIELSRQKAVWPKDTAEADTLWRDRIENEILTEILAAQSADKTSDKTSVKADKDKGAASNVVVTDKKDAADANKPADTPETRVAKRYDRLLRNLHEQTKEDESKFFLNSLALAYDPHSEYMSPSEMENFSINMRLSLIGIGAVLRKEDEYSKIIELVPGGPASSQGELKVEDRIAAVAQGNEAFVDAVDMKLDKVVEMIRGKKGTTVRLQVIPAGTTDTSKRKVITIVRDEVKLTDSEARAEIIEQKRPDGTVDKLGWITLPSFYADMDSAGRGNRGAGRKSTTHDVAALLARLNKEGINGLVVDLRRNGGGSLEEAVNLTGLFIKKGPVVQSKSYDKSMDVLSDKDPSIAYNGPMVVLTSHVSASASEIFAGALQDYNRALVVGDKNTFGKGTVQTLLEVGKFMSPFGFRMADAGALKLTIQKFYRPSGKSTQLKGVESDIVLPSRYAHLEVGEDALKYPLAFDEVRPADFEKWPGPQPDLNDLRTRSAGRVSNDPEFRYLQQDIDKMEKRIASNRLSLNKAERQTEIATDKKRTEEIKAERAARKLTPPVAYSLALADVDKPKLERIVNDKDKKDKTAAADANAKGTKDKSAEQKADAVNSDATADDADAESDEDVESVFGANKANVIDPIKTESLNILQDLIEQQRHVKLAKTRD